MYYLKVESSKFCVDGGAAGGAVGKQRAARPACPTAVFSINVAALCFVVCTPGGRERAPQTSSFTLFTRTSELTQ